MDVEILTFGCRLNTVGDRGDPARGEGRGVAETIVINTCAVTGEAVRQARQGDPQGAPGETAARASSSPAAPPRPSPRPSPRWTRSISCSATPRSSTRPRGAASRATTGPPARFSASRRRRRSASTDIMAVRETAAPPDRGPRRAHPRLRPGAERLRPSLHLLHHPVRPRPSRSVPMGAVVQEIRAIAERGHGGSGADRRRPHLLRPGPAGRAAARRTRPPHPQERAGAEAPAALLDRFHRGGRQPDAGDRGGGAADAALPPLAAGRRRHDPEAHEAPPFGGGRRALLHRGAAAAPRHRVRRRPYRGFPTETEAMFENSLAMSTIAG